MRSPGSSGSEGKMFPVVESALEGDKMIPLVRHERARVLKFDLASLSPVERVKVDWACSLLPQRLRLMEGAVERALRSVHVVEANVRAGGAWLAPSKVSARAPQLERCSRKEPLVSEIVVEL